ncbi:MAG: hypothetical protein ACRDXB_21415, partial [Actinomycetes bacterium]
FDLASVVPDLPGEADTPRYLLEHRDIWWVSANHRLHHMEAHRRGQQWKHGFGWQARRLSVHGLTRVHIAAYAFLPARHHRLEVDNLRPTLKAAVDGLRPPQSHLLRDDDDGTVIGTDLRRGGVHGHPWLLLRLVISDLSGK